MRQLFVVVISLYLSPYFSLLLSVFFSLTLSQLYSYFCTHDLHYNYLHPCTKYFHFFFFKKGGGGAAGLTSTDPASGRGGDCEYILFVFI